MNELISDGQTDLQGSAAQTIELCGAFGGVCSQTLPSDAFDLRTGQANIEVTSTAEPARFAGRNDALSGSQLTGRRKI